MVALGSKRLRDATGYGIFHIRFGMDTVLVSAISVGLFLEKRQDLSRSTRIDVILHFDVMMRKRDFSQLRFFAGFGSFGTVKI